MRKRDTRFFHDDDVAELFADEPELLAVVDAIAETQRPATPVARATRLRRRPLLIAAALGVAGLTVTLVAPWKSTSIVDDALAAVSRGSLIHAQVERTTEDDITVDLSSLQETPTRVTVEIWFDEESDRLRTRTMRNGVAIAEAAGTSGEHQPRLDPVLADFATGYRSALVDGRAASVDGENRLAVTLASGGKATVTLDATTLRPKSFTVGGGQSRVRWHVQVINTRAPTASDFPHIKPQRHPTAGAVLKSRAIPVGSSAVAGTPWLGRRFGTFNLVQVWSDDLVRTYADGRRSQSAGRRLVYRSPSGNRIEVRAAAQAEPAYGFAEGRLTLSFSPVPREGSAAVSHLAGGGGAWVAQLRFRGSFVTVRAATKELAATAAAALRSAP